MMKTKTPAKRRKCRKGYSCGSSCINVKLECRKGLTGQSVNIADRLANLLKQATKSEFGYTLNPRKPKSDLVKSEDIKVRPRVIRAMSKVGNHNLSAFSVNLGGNVWDTIFTVDDDVSRVKDASKSERAAIISSTRFNLERIFEAIPDGAIITNSPSDLDGLRDKRASLYRRFGFSERNSRGEQAAIKNGNRLTPYTFNN